MTVQEIFKLPSIDLIEREICHLYWLNERHWFRNKNSGEKEAIKQLLAVRKRLLDKEFVMDDHYKQLLNDFNKAMTEQLLQMRLAVISAYNALRQTESHYEITAIGKCFMAYQFSPIHPNQSKKEKVIWNLLCGEYGKFVPFYEDGVMDGGWRCDGSGPASENYMLYLNEQIDNWNDGLDPEQTADMHLIYPFHNLYEHTCFSIFDLLWVRDFNVEISVEYDYATYKE